MKRRDFIALLGIAAATWPLAARSQQIGKIPRLGILGSGQGAAPPGALGFYEGLRELGYAEGNTHAIEHRYGDWKSDQFGELAAELVQIHGSRRNCRDEYVASTCS